MARGSFLIKGGKGKVGFGERQVSPEDIISLNLDNSDDLFQINKKLDGLTFITSNNTRTLIYDRVPVLIVNEENFSNATYFNPNAYLILKNTKNEFFFGVDSSKPNSRFNPKGTIIKLDVASYSMFTNIRPSFYCPANESPVYRDSKVTFYKLYPSSPNTTSFRFSNGLSYNFSVIREDVPKNNDSSDLALIDVPPRTNVTADEIKAEVKNGVLYLTIKNTNTPSGEVSGFSICSLPAGYRPVRDFNVPFWDNQGGVYSGTIEPNGNVTVNINGNNIHGKYLQISIPVLDIRDQAIPVTTKF